MGTEEQELNGLIDSLTIDEGEKEGKIQTTKGERRDKKGSLDSVIESIKSAEPGCNFFTLNFSLRSSNRQIEMDGLEKAKAILSGASFADPADPNRELKPGDALLQNTKRHGF